MTGYSTPKTAGWFAIIVLGLAACTSKETRALLQPPQALGVVLAEEAARAKRELTNGPPLLRPMRAEAQLRRSRKPSATP
jgi:hypothetical protein